MEKIMPPSPNHLLNDARLISAYAATHGLLRQTKLLDAITAANDALSRNSWSIDIENRLLTAIDEVSHSMKPMSIETLESKQPGRTVFIGKIGAFFIITFTIYILVTVITLTSTFNQMRNSYDYLDNFFKTDIFKSFEEYDTYMKKIVNGKATDRSIEADKNPSRKYKELEASLLVELPIASYHLKNYDGSVFGSLISPLKKAEEFFRLNSDNFPKSQSVAMASQANPNSPASPIIPAVVEKPTPSPPESSDAMENASAFYQSTLQIRRTLQEKISILGSSILPMLYGLLGASVFLMRSFLGDNYVDAWRQASTAALILRIGLGGISGLAIGWFTLTPDASKLSTTPFAVAFIAGFSIELLFSLLDRFIIALGPQKPG
ncbi:hypothetical protein [Azospirillum largimobile]